MNGHHALFAISSLGLGHATRSLVLIEELLAMGLRVTILSSGTALSFLRSEMAAEPRVSFLEMEDYPALERGSGLWMYLYLAIDLCRTWLLIRRERKYLKDLRGQFELVISDGRYGFYSNTIPSFILTHQIAFMPPKKLRWLFFLTAKLNLIALRRFDKILIPDFPTAPNLSGALSHTPLLARHRHSYLGILSSYRSRADDDCIDYLFIISGYLIEHKDGFINSLVQEAKKLPGKKVFILGQKNCSSYSAVSDPDTRIYAMAEKELRQQLFARAKTVIARAGYSTVMDLVEHGKRAVLIPTPNQTEQEYLASYLGKENYFATTRQGRKLDLEHALARAKRTRPFFLPWKTATSRTRFRKSLVTHLKNRFFSIIVPAHNEEREIVETLDYLLSQHYPHHLYEIIVVENGSTDATYSLVQEKIKKSAPTAKISLYQSKKGVSLAKNHGLSKSSETSDWVIFCDADTKLGPFFLKQLNLHLQRLGQGVTIGTSQIGPHGDRHPAAGIWFSLYNIMHRLTATSYSLQLAKTEVARTIRFKEDLELAEDLEFIKGCRQYGSFFFIRTDQVTTSTRRFRSQGYLRLSLRWIAGALVPMRLKRRLRYDAIR